MLWLSLAASSAFAYYRVGSKLQLHDTDRAMAYLRPLSSSNEGILKEEPRPAPLKPDWAAGGLLSDFVNMLISFKPLFGMMKVGARSTLISTAEKNNIPWRALTQDLRTKMDVLSENYKQVLDNTITEYPSYYTQQFHAYDDGNLNWDAAFECESATMSMAIRTWPKEPLTVKQAQDRLRASFTDAIKQYRDGHEVSLSTVRRVLDVGCSVGVSTFYLADAFPAASTVDGLDLSPYFLAVARGRQLAQCGLDYLSSDPSIRPDASKYNHINWVHANIERTPFADNAYDIAACSFIFHELPTDTSVAIFKELYRIVDSGGVVSVAAAVAVVYYLFDLSVLMRAGGDYRLEPAVACHPEPPADAVHADEIHGALVRRVLLL